MHHSDGTSHSDDDWSHDILTRDDMAFVADAVSTMVEYVNVVGAGEHHAYLALDDWPVLLGYCQCGTVVIMISGSSLSSVSISLPLMAAIRQALPAEQYTVVDVTVSQDLTVPSIVIPEDDYAAFITVTPAKDIAANPIGTVVQTLVTASGTCQQFLSAVDDIQSMPDMISRLHESLFSDDSN